MDTNSYQAVKEYIFGKLSKVEGSLPSNKISEEVENAKRVIQAIGADTFAKILSIDEFNVPEDSDWSRLSSLHSGFNICHGFPNRTLERC